MSTTPLSSSKLLAQEVREALLLVREDLSRLVDERLGRARQLRDSMQSRITSLRQRCEQAEQALIEDPTVSEEGILGAVAWMEDGSQVPFERTLRLADEILDEKDAEIERLRQQLENLQQASANSIPDTSFAEIEAERHKLHQLQEEWREKMRRAEVEFSIERAKLTREHEQLTEKLCRLEAELERAGGDRQGGGGGRKWLRQLGLSDNDI